MLLELTFAQELIRELTGAVATAVLVTIAGTVIANRWTAGRAERREQFELRRELLDRSQRVGGEFWIKLQHASRALPSSQEPVSGLLRRLRRALVSAAADRRRDADLWRALDDSYHTFVVEISALENEIGSRYGFSRTLTAANEPQSFLRCHQVRDLLTMYYFNLKVASGQADRFPDNVKEINSEDPEGEYHAGMDFRAYSVEASDLMQMRIEIRSTYENAMRELAEALLREPMRTTASR